MITNGEFKYQRRLNTGDYSHKEATATISWSAEGDQRDVPAILAEAVDAAATQVARILSGAATVLPPAAVAVATPVGPETQASPNLGQQLDMPMSDDVGPMPSAVVQGLPAGLKRRGRPPKQQIVPELVDPEQQIVPELVDPEQQVKQAQPDAVLELTKEMQEQPSVDPSAPAIEMFNPPAAEITDDALMSACQRKANNDQKLVLKIRELVGEFSMNGLIQIPQVRRAEFINRLGNVTS